MKLFLAFAILIMLLGETAFHHNGDDFAYKARGSNVLQTFWLQGSDKGMENRSQRDVSSDGFSLLDSVHWTSHITGVATLPATPVFAGAVQKLFILYCSLLR